MSIYELLVHLREEAAYAVRHVVGVDSSELHVARTGVRGNNDLVWVGRAANYAAKLSSLSDDYSTRVTEEVYKRLNESVKHLDGRSIWEEANWIKMDNMPIYRSNAWWEFP
jgi:class 3 adenylate cyclase